VTHQSPRGSLVYQAYCSHGQSLVEQPREHLIAPAQDSLRARSARYRSTRQSAIHRQMCLYLALMQLRPMNSATDTREISVSTIL
jgi:hypothetical protein